MVQSDVLNRNGRHLRELNQNGAIAVRAISPGIFGYPHRPDSFAHSGSLTAPSDQLLPWLVGLFSADNSPTPP